LAGRIDRFALRDVATETAKSTARQLRDEAITYLTRLPTIAELGEFTRAHGSPRDPTWEYVVSPNEAAESFESYKGAAGLVGHNHVPLGYGLGPAPDWHTWTLRKVPVVYHQAAELERRRHLINVGRVGQPCDGDPQVRYLILDPNAGRF
jgi:hypothetical protein